MKTLKGPSGIKLLLDTDDSATPAIVEHGRLSSTYDCAMATEMIDNQYELSVDQLKWLDNHYEEVEETIYEARQDCDDYN